MLNPVCLLRSQIRAVIRSIRHLFNRDAPLARELDEELRTHIELRTQANIAAGMVPESARRAALQQFGSTDAVKEACCDSSRARWLEHFVQDLRFAARQLRKSPWFTTVAVLSLGLGIGAGTAVFSVLNAILLRSLPVPNPHELRVLQWTGLDARPRSISGDFKVEGNRATAECVSPDLSLSLRQSAVDVADLFAFAPVRDAVVRARGDSFAGDGLIVSDNFFSALGVRPRLGRLFAPGQSVASAGEQVVISYEWWDRHFAQDPSVVGQALAVNGRSLTILGVAARGFAGVRPANPPGFFVLLSPTSPFAERAVSAVDHWWVRLMARLRPSANDARLKAALDSVFIPAVQSQVRQPEMLVQAGHNGLAFERNSYGTPLLLMLIAVGLVLLVACANIAGLLLAKGIARQHELSVRAALGAGRGRLIRQSLVESLSLALLGGVLGILIATWGKAAISRLLAQSSEGLRYDLSLDLRVLGFTLTVALLTALLFGLLPALRAGRTNPLDGLKARVGPSTTRLPAGRVLVIAQVALALVLLAGAGLFLRTLSNLRQIDAGFRTEKLLLFQLNANSAGYEGPQLGSFYARVQTALTALPGVQGAALTVFPLLDNKSSSGGFTYGERALAPGENPSTFRLVVGETFLDTLGIPLLRGRSLRSTDTAEAAPAIVVNERFVQKYFPDQEPLGRVIRTWSTDWRIVGVCADAKYQHIKEPVPATIYIPFRQFPLRFGAYFVVRTSLPPLALASAVRKTIAAIDPAVPVSHLTTQEQIIDRTISQERLFASLCSAFAGFALLLACLGLYGLMTFDVQRRTSEIAIRMAVGARPAAVAGTIVRDAFGLAVIGVGIGLPTVLAVTQLIRSQLYGVQPHDLVTLLSVTALLLIVVLAAAWLPAYRAARLDPIQALRTD